MFNIIFYRNTAETNRIDKSNYITELFTLSGSLRDSCSITNPSIIIDIEILNVFNLVGFNNPNFTEVTDSSNNKIGYTTKGIPECNYCYIPQFNRYYFINNITSYRQNLWVLDMTCDTLMSYKSYLYDLDVFVSRQEYDINKYVVDSELPINIKPYKYRVNNIGRNQLIDPRSNYNGNNYCYVLVVSDNQISTGISSYESFIDNPRAVSGYTTGIYLLTGEQVNRLADYISRNTFAQDLSRLVTKIEDAILSLTLYPFNVDECIPLAKRKYVDNIGVGTFGSIPIKTASTPDLPQVIYVGGNFYTELDIGEFKIREYYKNFLDYSPYTKISMYIPTLGYLDLDTNLVMNNDITVKLCVDLFTNRSAVKIRMKGNINTPCDIQMFQTNIGISLPLTTGFANEITKNLLQSGIGLYLGISNSNSKTNTSIIKARQSGESDEPIKEIRNVEEKQEIKNSVSEFTVNMMQNVSTGVSGNFSAGWSSYNLEWNTFCIISRTQPIYTTLGISSDNVEEYIKKYNHMIGSPSSYNGKLINLKGFTVVSGVHLENIIGILSNELGDIDTKLKSGVIV